MKNELLTIGPFTVYGYGLMIAIGILAGCLTAEYRAGKQKLDSEQIFPMILWCLVGGFFCAKLLFWITEWKSIVQDPGFIMETLSSGFVVFGGIIGGILTGLLYCRIRKLVFFKYADVILPSVALAQGFDTYKLKYGHRGINHPVKDLAAGRAFITSQNHGYTVSAASLKDNMRISHVNWNDQTIEGLVYTDHPSFTVQFHPEAVLTQYGHELLENFHCICQQWQQERTEVCYA